MPDHGAQPFVCLAMERDSEVRERCDVVPFVGDLAFVNASHEFESRDGVLGRVSIEVREFDDLRFHGDIGVGLNLPCQICSIIVALEWWLIVLEILLVENRIRVDIGHDVFEVVLVEVVELERMKVLVLSLLRRVSSFHFEFSAGSVIRKPVLYTNIVKRVSWFKSSL